MEIDLKDLLLGLIKKWYWVVVGLVLGAVLGYVSYKTNAAPVYTATALLEVCAESDGTLPDNINNDIAKLNYEHALIATILDAINSDKNLDRVAANVNSVYAEENTRLGEERYQPVNVSRHDIRAAVTATGGGDTKTLFITVRVSTANRTDAIAYINSYINEAISTTEALGHPISLVIADDMRPSFEHINNDVNVVNPAGTKNIIVGGVIGLALSAVIILLAFGMDKRVKSETEISDRYGLPVLAVLPEISARRDK